MTASERAQIARLTEIVERIEVKVDDTADRVRGLEDASLLAKGERRGEARVFGLAKSSIAIAVAIASALVTLAPAVLAGILHK